MGRRRPHGEREPGAENIAMLQHHTTGLKWAEMGQHGLRWAEMELTWAALRLKLG